MIGKTVSHYRIVEKLGEGGMGVVYKAEDTKLKRMVALKFLPPELTRDPEAKERFIQEAQAASALDHLNICNIHEIDETAEGQLFICMACYGGETLKERIARGPLGTIDAARIAAQIGEGLAKAHAAGIVHRDMKPANIMITSEGVAKILDFGLAKLSGRTQHTKTGTTLGTVAYMSPEQARGAAADYRTDIWSFGVILYEMLTGQRPFGGDYDQAVTYSILNDEPRSVTSIRPDVPGSIGDIIAKCLEKDPENRYGSAEEFTKDIQQIEVGLRPMSPRGAMQKSRELPSIAVLPFRDMSPARDQEYFCEGIAEELINGLAQIAGLRVAARTSAFQFKDKDLDVRRVGKELGVESVLEGSVRKAANRLRITAQLINVADGYHLWSEKYDRELEDVFAIQDEISMAIVEKLRGKLLKEEKSKLVKRRTEDEEAYNLYLKGRYYWNRRHEGGIQKAIELFQQAVEKDPLCAPGYVGVADCYNVSAILAFMDPRIAYAKSKKAVAKALEIDDDLVEAHASLGWIKTFHDWDWVGAEAEFLRAFELNPNYATAHYFYSLYLGVMGRHDESLAESSRALELDPIDLVFNSIQAVTLFWGRRYDAAIQQVQKTLDMDPNFYLANLYGGFAFAAKTRWQEALGAFTRASEVSPGNPLVMGFIGWALAASGRKKDALEMLDRLEELSKARFVGSFHKALVHLGLKADNRVFECLESAFVEKESWLAITHTFPILDDVRSDPRFIAIMRRMGLQK
jgi:TolB-like protein/tRNA A-37 threonylcarbamoyl transferase component Bud32/Tfp pilus assembly protein PilF